MKVTDLDFLLLCDWLTINFGTNSSKDEIETVIAKTNVVLVQKGTRAFGDQAVYTFTNETIVLSAFAGEVLVGDAKNFLIASVVIYNRITGKILAPGTVTVGIPSAGSALGTSGLIPAPFSVETPRHQDPSPKR